MENKIKHGDYFIYIEDIIQLSEEINYYYSNPWKEGACWKAGEDESSWYDKTNHKIKFRTFKSKLIEVLYGKN